MKKLRGLPKKVGDTQGRFSIGEKVTSSINSRFLGQITAINQYGFTTTYTVSHFCGDEPRIATMYEFELDIIKNEPLGFNRKV